MFACWALFWGWSRCKLKGMRLWVFQWSDVCLIFRSIVLVQLELFFCALGELAKFLFIYNTLI